MASVIRTPCHIQLLCRKTSLKYWIIFSISASERSLDTHLLHFFLTKESRQFSSSKFQNEPSVSYELPVSATISCIVQRQSKSIHTLTPSARNLCLKPTSHSDHISFSTKVFPSLNLLYHLEHSSLLHSCFWPSHQFMHPNGNLG